MDEKRRSKRKSMDDGFWDCSVCTYRNTPEAFKCDMCDVRKGTSTRKPRFNPQLAAQQVVQQFTPAPKKEKSHRRDKESREHKDRDLDPYNDDSNFGDESIDTDQTSVHSHETDMDAASVSDSHPEPRSAEKPKLEAAKSESVTPAPHKKEPKEPKEKKSGTPSGSQPRKPRTPRLKNIDRSSGTSMEVTVGGVTVVITDYKPKKEKAPAITPSTSVEAPPQKEPTQPSPGTQSDTASDSVHSRTTPDTSWSETTGSQQTNGHIATESKSR